MIRFKIRVKVIFYIYIKLRKFFYLFDNTKKF